MLQWVILPLFWKSNSVWNTVGQCIFLLPLTGLFHTYMDYFAAMLWKASSVLEYQKSTLLSLQPSWLKSPFFPLALPTLCRQSGMPIFRFLSSLSQIALLFLSLSHKGEKVKRKKLELLLRSGVKAFSCSAPCPVSLLSPFFWAGVKTISLWEQRAWHFQV